MDPSGHRSVVRRLLPAHRHWLLPRAFKPGSGPSVTSPRRGGCRSSASSPRRLGALSRRSAGVNPVATRGVLKPRSACSPVCTRAGPSLEPRGLERHPCPRGLAVRAAAACASRRRVPPRNGHPQIGPRPCLLASAACFPRRFKVGLSKGKKKCAKTSAAVLKAWWF